MRFSAYEISLFLDCSLTRHAVEGFHISIQMKIRLRETCYVRHIGNESLLVSPRTGGCTVLSHARTFIEELSSNWIDTSDFISAVARKCATAPYVIKDDAQMICEELATQGFVDCDVKPHENLSTFKKSNRHDTMASKDDMPLSDFYRRHNCPPIEFHIDLTDACTERCVHCYVPQGHHHYLPYELAEKAIREFREMEGLTVHLTGGEAMLHPDFKRICVLCKSIGLNTIVFSNMTLCDATMIDFLHEIDPQFVNVSLYAMNPLVHDGITRLPGSWRKTMDAILRCVETGVHIRIASPLLKDNKDEFEALERFADKLHLHLIPNFDIVPRSDHDCSNLCHACSDDELYSTLKKHKNLFDEGYNDIARPKEGKVCSIGIARVYLNAEGYYYPCDSMHRYILGSAEKDSLSEIWRCDKLNVLRKLRDADYPKCQNCQLRPFCKICPAYNFNATGNVLGFCPEKCTVAHILHDVYGGN